MQSRLSAQEPQNFWKAEADRPPATPCPQAALQLQPLSPWPCSCSPLRPPWPCRCSPLASSPGRPAAASPWPLAGWQLGPKSGPPVWPPGCFKSLAWLLQESGPVASRVWWPWPFARGQLLRPRPTGSCQAGSWAAAQTLVINGRLHQSRPQ